MVAALKEVVLFWKFQEISETNPAQCLTVKMMIHNAAIRKEIIELEI